MKTFNSLFKISAILWIIWGLVHLLAGVLTINFILTDDISSSISGIADAVDASTLQMNYPDALGAIIGQHGFNLFWIGLVTLISAFFIWKGNKNAIFLAAITGGLADLGYFLFLDLGGHVNFLPGSLMTYISASAIILSFYAHFKSKELK
jgi:hypothetical protein